MSDIKLTYFGLKGRAEISRLIFAYAGVDFTDERLSREEFAAIKGKLPFGQMPLLNFKGTQLCQSMTIARFLAEEYGLAGTDNVSKAQANEAVDAIIDMGMSGIPGLFAQGDDRAKIVAEFAPKADKGLQQLEARLASRGGQFFAGNKLTWADLMLFNMIDILSPLGAIKMENYPKLNNLRMRVSELPNIKAYVARRPAGI